MSNKQQYQQHQNQHQIQQDKYPILEMNQNYEMQQQSYQQQQIFASSQGEQQIDYQNNLQFTPQQIAYYIDDLKKNYLQRLESFQLLIKDVCDRLNGDEVLESFKNDTELEQFRNERFKEILKLSFSYEQEEYIDKMIEANAMLKLDLKKAEEEKSQEIDMAKMEIQAISKQVLQFENAMQQEIAQKTFLQNEYEKLIKQKNLDKANYEELMKIKDSSKTNQDVMYKQELQNSRVEIENLLKEKSTLSIENEQMKEQIATLTKNLYICSLKQQSKSESDRLIDQKYEEFKSQILKQSSQIQELQNINEHLIEQIQLRDQEIEVIKISLAETQKENDFLSDNTEKLKMHSTKTESNIQEKTSEISKKLEKIRSKKKALKEKFNQTKQSLEYATREIQNYQKQFQENRSNKDTIIQTMKRDMLIIKNEWEKKCIEVEQECQAKLQQAKIKQDYQIQKLKNEYQQIIDKNMIELGESNNQLNFSKGFSSQIQMKMQQLEKDYILKSTHEKILEEEITKIQGRHQENINQISERHQNNVQTKIKEISERKTKEYEILSQGLQSNYLDLQAKLQEQIKLNSQFKEKILETENTFLKAKDENNQQNLYIKQQNEVKEESAKIQQRLENDISTLKNDIEKINKQKNEIEEQLQEQLELNQQLNKNLEQLQNQLEEYCSKEQQYQTEIEQLQNNLQQVYETQESLNCQLEQLKQKQDADKQSALRDAHYQENMKFEQEKEDHEETKMKLLQQEKKMKMAQKELEQQEEEYEERIQQIQDKLIKVQGQKEKIEAEKRDIVLQNNDLQQKLDLFTTKIQRDKQRICKRFGLQLKSLKDDLEDLKQDNQSDIQNLFEYSKQAIYKVIEHQNEIKQNEINQIEINYGYNQEQLLNEFNEKMEQIEDNMRNQQSEATEELQNIIEQLKQENDQLQDNIQQLQTQNDVLEKEKKQLDNLIQSIEKHNERLESIIKKNSEDMEEHNKFFASGINRIKDESNNLVNLAVESALSSSKQDIEVLQKKLTSLSSLNDKINNQQEAISDLKKEVQQKEQNLDDLHNHYENELRDKEEELDKKDMTIEQLRNELQEMQLAYEKMQEENNQGFEVLESKLENYKQTINNEAEKYQIVKEQSSFEIQNLNEELNKYRQQLTLKEQNIETLTKQQDFQTYSKRHLPPTFNNNSSIINTQYPEHQVSQNTGCTLPPQPPSHFNVFQTQRNSQQQQNSANIPLTNYSITRTLKQNNSASNLMQTSSNNTAIGSNSSFQGTHQHGNSSASKTINSSLNYHEKPIKLESNTQVSAGGIYKQQEKSYAKQHFIDKSFDAQRLEIISDLSRQHKIYSQAKLVEQQTHNVQLPLVKGTSIVSKNNNYPVENNSQFNNQITNNHNISQSRNLKTNTSSDSGLLCEIKHLLAQSYDLVNKNTNIINVSPATATTERDENILSKQNQRGILTNNTSLIIPAQSSDNNISQQYSTHGKIISKTNNMPQSYSNRQKKSENIGNLSQKNKMNSNEYHSILDISNDNNDTQNINPNNNNISKKSLTPIYSTKNSEFSFKNSNN